MKKIILFVFSVFIMLSLSACGKSWTCDWCDKTWTGEAYYGGDYNETLCDECAYKYWDPMPYKNYKK